ncbi:hypothetical protein ILYODFUR_015964 [Ilyodon furcidens]|uniref:Uncharacterized protein n=1 Tax=Ilyodon furcidens TaxID=33524 RepID=A0ABV0T9P8_9TELE
MIFSCRSIQALYICVLQIDSRHCIPTNPESIKVPRSFNVENKYINMCAGHSDTQYMLLPQQQIECPFNYAGDIRKKQHSSHSGKQFSEYTILEAVTDRGKRRERHKRGLK